MSGWDFINDEMGGWDEDGLPNFQKDPNFYSDGYGNTNYAYFYCNYLEFRNFHTAVGLALNAYPYAEDIEGQDNFNKRISYEKDCWIEIERIISLSSSESFCGQDFFIYINPELIKLVISSMKDGKVSHFNLELDINEYRDEKEVEKMTPFYRSVLTNLKESLCEDGIPNISQHFLKRLNRNHFRTLYLHKNEVHKLLKELKKLEKDNSSSADLRSKVIEIIEKDYLIECIGPNWVKEYDSSKVALYIEFKDKNKFVEFKVKNEDNKEFHLFVANEDGTYSRSIFNSYRFLEANFPLQDGYFVVRK